MNENMDQMKMVKIVAEDWRLDPANLEIEKARALQPAVCIVVGMLLNESKSKVIICQEYFKEEDTVRSLVVVPTACILSLVELKMATNQNFLYPIKVDGAEKILTATEAEEIRIKSSKWENQTLEEQCREMLVYIGSDLNQGLIPPGRVQLMTRTLDKLAKEKTTEVKDDNKS